MQLKIHWIEVLRNKPIVKQFNDFTQKMANRLILGNMRYGDPNKDKKYLTRLNIEIKAYRRTGNAEHLYNIANYCVLETIAPENKKFHFDPMVDSATRGKI